MQIMFNSDPQFVVRHAVIIHPQPDLLKIWERTYIIEIRNFRNLQSGQF